MTAAALTTRLEKEALERHGTALARPLLLRRVQDMLKEAQGNESHVEMVVCWIMAQEAEDFRVSRLTLDKFYAVSHTIGCPDEAAWPLRLWEYDLALEDATATEGLRSSITYWLDYWTDAKLVYDASGIERARTMLGLLRKGYLAR